MNRFKRTLFFALASLGERLYILLFRHMTRTGLVLCAVDDAPTDIPAALERIRQEVKTPIAELKAQVLDLEQRAARGGGGGGGGDFRKGDRLDLGKLLEDSAGFAALKSKNTPKCRIELPANFMASKAAMTSTTTGAALEADRRPVIVVPGQRKMTIRDLLPTLPTEAGSVEYVRETAFTNGAATQAEGQVKGQSSVTLEIVSAKVATIAHWAHASKQILDDVPQLASFLEMRLRYGLEFAEELQLLLGAGTGTDLAGLYTLATPYSAPFTLTAPTMLDQSRAAMTQLENANYTPTGFVLHPNDWTRIELLKTADGEYLKTNPSDANRRVLWGLPVVTTTAMTEDKFLVGDFDQAAVIFDREEPTLDIATQDADDFQRNLVKLRVEERLALAVMLPAALVKGDFGNLA